MHSLSDRFTPADLIRIYFDDNNARQNLLDLQQDIFITNDLTFIAYTDGSLQGLASDNITMTYRFILLDSQSVEYTFKSKITNWPSSTRAEIMAIASTLLVLPFGNSVTIYTDSQATIDGFNSHIKQV